MADLGDINKVLDKSDALDRMFFNTSVRTGDSLDVFSLFLRSPGIEKDKQDVRPTCKFFNVADSGKCIQLNCRFDHVCPRCDGNHLKKAYTQKQ